MKNFKKLILLVLVFSLVIFVGCSNDSKDNGQSEEVETPVEETETTEEKTEEAEKPVEEEKEKVTIRLAGGNWGHPSPYRHATRGPGFYKMYLIFDSLLERGEEDSIPWLAKDWDISEDGTEYTFYLEDGVKWHDGEDFSAEDVKFTIEYFTEHPPVNNSLDNAGVNYIESVEVVDDNTIKVKTFERDNTVLDKIGSMRIIPKHIWENVEDPMTYEEEDCAIGCGPYKFDYFNGEEGAYRFVANEDYWGCEPVAEAIEFIPVSDDILAFEAGEIDLIGIGPDLIPQFEGRDGIKIIDDPAVWGYVIYMNMEKAPELQNKDVRHAIAYGINQEEIIEKVQRGAGKPASAGYLPVDHKDYNPNVKKYEYNPEKARELLNGETYDLELVISDSQKEVKIAELLKIYMDDIGINLTVRSMDGQSRDGLVKDKEYQMALNGFGGWARDPDSLRTRYSSKNLPGYSNEEIDKLAQEQLVCPIEERAAIIDELQLLISEEIPTLPLINTSSYTVYNANKYDGWKHVYNHHEVTHNKISFVECK